MLLQNVARHKLLVALRQPIHLFDNLLQTKMLGETQRSAAIRGESGSENHSVIRVLGRIYHFFFNATRRFIDHQKHQAIRKIDIVFRGTIPTPLAKRLIRELLSAFIFIKAGAALAAKQFGFAHRSQNFRRAVATSIRFFEGGRDIHRNVNSDLVDQA